MTIRQFAYLATGLGSAYLVFALLQNTYPLVAYPLIVILSGSGAALAFLPIQDRPLDHWLGAYFRAIFQPTKRSYKSKILTKEDPLFKSRLQVFLSLRRKASGPIFKDPKTKSTPFSFNVASMVQAPVAPQPLIATTIPAPTAQAAAPIQNAVPVQKPPQPQVMATTLPPLTAPRMTPPPAQPQPVQQPVTPPSAAAMAAPPIQFNAPSITIMAPPPPPPPTQPVSPPPPKPVVEAQVLGTAGLSAIDIPEAKPIPTPAAAASAVLPVNTQITNPIVIKPAVINIVNTPAPQQRPFVPDIPIPTLSASPVQTMPKPAPPPAPRVPEVPTEADLSHTIEIAKQVHQVQQKILKTEQQIESIRTQSAAQDADPKQYLNQFHQLLGELQNLNQQAANLSSQVAELTNEPMRLPSLQADLVVKAKSIPTITLTSIANVINGIVTDSNGNYLDGSIILAHDKSGIPVRALKTNKLGQFVAATPLNNGIYTITIEKDELVFDTIELELRGEVLKPILITSKPVIGGVVHG